MNIVGIDASPHSTGLVKFILDEQLNILEITKLGFKSHDYKKKKGPISYKDIITYPESLDFFNRTLFMQEPIFEFIKDCEYAVIEDYSLYGSGLVFQLAEFCSTIKFQLIKQGTKIRLIEPLTNKMFATDDGTAQKPEMYDAFISDEILKTIDISYLPIIPTHSKGEFVGLRNKKGISPTSDIVDAGWLCRLLHEELLIRKGIKTLKDLIPHHSHILSRKTKPNPKPIIEKDFIYKKN